MVSTLSRILADKFKVPDELASMRLPDEVVMVFPLATMLPTSTAVADRVGTTTRPDPFGVISMLPLVFVELNVLVFRRRLLTATPPVPLPARIRLVFVVAVVIVSPA